MHDREFRLILASGSPQRKILLDKAGYQFRILVPDPGAECGVCSRESPGEMVARLARQKAADVMSRLQAEPSGLPAGEILVACDTVCECLGQVLGKPSNREHARQMLRSLSGQEHRVYSGLCVWPLSAGARQVRVARTTLRMDPLDSARIEEYLDSDLWEGKAGAFGYQDRAGWLHIVEGSESNVVGLPLELLAEMLAAV
jgi:septum formation protein